MFMKETYQKKWLIYIFANSAHESLFFSFIFFQSCWINTIISAHSMPIPVMGIGNRGMNRATFLPIWGRQAIAKYASWQRVWTKSTVWGNRDCVGDKCHFSYGDRKGSSKKAKAEVRCGAWGGTSYMRIWDEHSNQRETNVKTQGRSVLLPPNRLYVLRWYS